MTSSRRHVPLRTCVICGNKTSKRDLTRIVATPSGDVKVDPSGKLSGRGAYVCSDGACARQGLKRGRLEYTLRTKLRDEEWAEFTSSLETTLSAHPD